ncbi:hypothetical protein BYT27DRAFT_6961651 [Phlegmacium glaucopus]|nr:hypothetical protein BYT27DRAFT_6961651 [Phlegmacium glaucopus]
MLISQSIHYILFTTLYSRCNSRRIEYPCCNPNTSLINVVYAIVIGPIGTITGSTSTCCVNLPRLHQAFPESPTEDAATYANTKM